jgi:transcriptional regulator with XRE-family HTH domain
MNLMAEQDRPTHTERTDLSDLVRKRRAELRLSLRALEQRTADPGTGEPAVKYGWLNNLEKAAPNLTPPRLPVLDALAKALELPLGRLQDAAGAQFFGIDTVWSASGEARALVTRADQLSPEQREQIYRLIDMFAPRSDVSDT